MLSVGRSRDVHGVMHGVAAPARAGPSYEEARSTFARSPCRPQVPGAQSPDSRLLRFYSGDGLIHRFCGNGFDCLFQFDVGMDVGFLSELKELVVSNGSRDRHGDRRDERGCVPPSKGARI